MQVLEDALLDPNEVSKKLIKLEDRSRRNNVRFDGADFSVSKTNKKFFRMRKN